MTCFRPASDFLPVYLKSVIVLVGDFIEDLQYLCGVLDMYIRLRRPEGFFWL